MGPTKDRIMTKDETEDCTRVQEGGQNRLLKKAEPGEKQTRTLKKTRGRKERLRLSVESIEWMFAKGGRGHRQDHCIQTPLPTILATRLEGKSCLVT